MESLVDRRKRCVFCSRKGDALPQVVDDDCDGMGNGGGGHGDVGWCWMVSVRMRVFEVCSLSNGQVTGNGVAVKLPGVVVVCEMGGRSGCGFEMKWMFKKAGHLEEIAGTRIQTDLV
jgi:hypothetical protein